MTSSKHNNPVALSKFIILSAIGVFLFMFPISTEDGISVPIAMLANWMQGLIKDYIFYILCIIIAISTIGSTFVKIFKPRRVLDSEFLSMLFNPTWLWYVLRIIAFIFTAIIWYCHVFNNPNPQVSKFVKETCWMIISPDTGSTVLYDLLPVLFTVFFLAGILLPLLMDFGLLEFVGSSLSRIMRPFFGLPGRATIDCVASWLGDGSIGVLLTSKQYEDGFYTEKEAAVISTTFSLVSLTFSIIIIENVGLGSKFISYYLTVCIACVVAAIIVPKLPPLSRKKNALITGAAPNPEPHLSRRETIKAGYHQALEIADSKNVVECVFKKGFRNVLDMWISVIPVVMSAGTLAMILANYTPVFKILGVPFIPYLKLLGVPEAVAASQTLIAGFADMLIPSILAKDIASDMTKFIIAAVSVSQLIYLSEVGALILSSKIPLKLWELFVIFILRTIVTLPIISIIAHIIF